MSVYLSWGQSHSVFNREDLSEYIRKHKYIATSKLCSECKIFDSQKQKCTHPLFGCESNPLRHKPWESESICPKKIKPS
jgi:hypothetical protein